MEPPARQSSNRFVCISPLRVSSGMLPIMPFAGGSPDTYTGEIAGRRLASALFLRRKVGPEDGVIDVAATCGTESREKRRWRTGMSGKKPMSTVWFDGIIHKQKNLLIAFVVNQY